ncbi:alpha/beta hydrolase [Bradyrhizobium sp. BRP22]|uniref:alpha/beta fold hydrolase n=1 Tax=Bradyrhizobium sp. BRP22 TaxID=2793821 RepID=UPI001CD778CC|nr:alpha/beta hydrolase [Bradyrhizobium sp. BRP22]MCA1451605.1 alpha/beta hydrolase [Bradyrhizobium sp. BRP22]
MSVIDALAPGSHNICIDGVEQCYHVAGQGPLCIVHPGGPGVDWAYLKMPEVELHLTILYIEPIGTGGSGRLPEHPEGYNVERYSHQLEGLVDALDLTDFFLLGHSHGGLVIQQYALTHPDRVAGVIVYGSSAVVGAELLKAAGQNILAFAQREAGLPEADEVVQAWRSIPSAVSDEVYTQTLRRLLPACFADYRRADVAYRQLRSSLRATFVVGDDKPFDVRKTLQNLSIPALVLAGAHDFICGPKWAEILHAALQGSQLVVFQLSGHMIHVEQPVAFAGVISAFVFRNRNSRRRRRSSRNSKVIRLLN